MGRVRVQLAVSADGFIAPVDGSFSWLEPFPAEEFGIDRFLASVGTIVMGRSSYDDMLKMGPVPYGAIPTVVITSRPLSGAPGHVRAIGVGRLRETMNALREEPKDSWLFGGARTIAACLEEGVVDTLELAVIPRLLGDGTRLFAPRAPTLESLRLVESRPMSKGVVWLTYEIER